MIQEELTDRLFLGVVAVWLFLVSLGVGYGIFQGAAAYVYVQFVLPILGMLVIVLWAVRTVSFLRYSKRKGEYFLASLFTLSVVLYQFSNQLNFIFYSFVNSFL